MLPFWLLTLGNYIMQQQHVSVNIPFQNIIGSLFGIIIPLSIGILIKRFKPEVAKKLQKVFKPVIICVILVVSCMGFATNMYIFKLFTPTLFLAGCLLPYIGFIAGGAVAALLRQPWYRVKTIAIETGIQNVGITMMIVKLTLPQPDADLSLVAPVVILTCTPIPLIILVCIREIRLRCCNKDNLASVNKDLEYNMEDVNDPGGKMINDYQPVIQKVLDNENDQDLKDGN